MTRHFVMGKNSVGELVKSDPKRILKIYTTRDFLEDPLMKEIEERGIPFKTLSKATLSQMVQSESHQGYIADVQDREMPSVKEFLSERPEGKEIVLMLDSIFDPQNFGTLLRSAECFGVSAVVYSKNRGTEITPVVTKTSVGASELVTLLRVSNLAQTAAEFQREGFEVLIADVGDKSSSLYDFTFPEKTLLIMGSEGRGVQPLLAKKADRSLYIPMKGQIDSLNVSQALSVILAFWSREC